MGIQAVRDIGLLTGEEGAHRLGISRSHFYRLAADRSWQYGLVGRTRLYRAADIQAYKPMPVGNPLWTKRKAKRSPSKENPPTTTLPYDPTFDSA